MRYTFIQISLHYADKIKDLLIAKFSLDGSSSRQKEEATYMMFIDFLYNCEGNILCSHCDFHNLNLVFPIIHIAGKTDTTLSQVLQFITGAAEIPPQGFDPTPSILFNDNNIYPKSSTCALHLELPTQYASQGMFEEKMVYGLLNHGGFGLY